MVSYFRSKDRRIRRTTASGELLLLRLNFYLRNSSLDLASKQAFFLNSSLKLRKNSRLSMRGRNRCLLTTRAGSVYRYFRLSRISLKGLASYGYLTGVRKSSW